MTFPRSRLRVVARARSHDAETRRLALAAIVDAFWKPVYFRLRLKWCFDPGAAADLTHAFFSTALERAVIARYDPVRGRLREFLRGCVDDLAAGARTAGLQVSAGSRAALAPLDFAAAEGELAAMHRPPEIDHDDVFYRGWVRGLFDRAVMHLRAAAAANGQTVMFDVFERYDLAPEGTPRPTYAALGDELGLRPATVTSHLASIRRRVRQHVLEQVRDLTSTDEEYETEARRLFGRES